MQNLSVAHVTLHGCVRAHKMAMVQTNMGMGVHFVSNFIAPTHSATGYSSVHIFSVEGSNAGEINLSQLQNTIRILSPHVDLFHVHNEPNFIFRPVKENTDKPVIWDIHDWTSIREGSIPHELEEEKYALEAADAFVVPSKGYLEKIRGISKKPALLLYSKVPQFLYPSEPLVRKPGLTYEGGIKGKNENDLYNYPYRNWAQFVGKVAENLNGDKIYLYSANGGDDFSEYAKNKIELSQPVMYDQLLRNLSQHTAGLVGSPYPLPDFQDSMPNKLFEYIASGIPVIVINSPEAERYVNENGLGISVQDASEVPGALERLKDHPVSRDRWKYTMEGEIPSLISLYEELTGCSRRVIAQN